MSAGDVDPRPERSGAERHPGERARTDARDRAEREAPRTGDGGRRLFRIVVGTVVAAAALRVGQPVLVPLAAGIFLAVLARPLQLAIARPMPRRLRWLGLVGAMLVVIAGVGAFGAALGFSGRAIAGELRQRRGAIEQTLAQARASAQRAGLPASIVPQWPRGEGSDGASGQAGSTGGTSGAAGATSGAGAGTANVGSASAQPGQSSRGGRDAASSRATGSAPSGGAQTASGGSGGGSGGGRLAGTLGRAAAVVAAGLGELLLALAFCALALAEAGQARERLARAVPPDIDPPVLDTVDEATRAFRRYAWVKTATSALTGVATWLATLALGLPLAWVWGLIAFLLEYVPSVGSALAVIPPVVMALAVGGVSKAVTTLLLVGGLQVLLGNVVDPRLEGKLMEISAFGVLLSIVLWGWLWGPVGALLAVPLTVAVVIVSRHVPGARGLAILVTGSAHGHDERGESGQAPDARPAKRAGPHGGAVRAD